MSILLKKEERMLPISVIIIFIFANLSNIFYSHGVRMYCTLINSTAIGRKVRLNKQITTESGNILSSFCINELVTKNGEHYTWSSFYKRYDERRF